MAKLDLDKQLSRLATLSPADLRREWEQVHGAPCPKLIPSLLQLGIAYRLQEKVSGKRIGSLAARLASRTRTKVGDRFAPGTQFMRSLNGRTVSVTAEEGGFLYAGQLYPSLSAIAREVTGAHWSGPRFFGLATKAYARG